MQQKKTIKDRMHDMEMIDREIFGDDPSLVSFD